jgi:large subunit ribosomal protein L21
MYAVIENGGKQYRVTPGETVNLEKICADAGAEVVFEQVLMVQGDQVLVGTPVVAGAKVIGEVVKQGRGDKVMLVKYRKRKTYNKRQGHRQAFTAVKIKEIKVG